MRAFRSKSLSFRATQNEPTWDPYLDLRRDTPPEASSQDATIRTSPPSSYSTTPYLSKFENRPLTANSNGERRDHRNSFSRPRTATIFTRRTLLVRSLLRHDIDPHHSSLIDDDCVGIGSGSPSFGVAPPPSEAFVRPATTGPGLGHDSRLQNEGDGNGLRRRSSTWRAIGDLFGRKRQDEQEEDPIPPLPPMPLMYSEERPSSRRIVAPVEINPPRFSSHFSRRRRSEAGPRPRKSLTIRRTTKPILSEPEVPELPKEKLYNTEPPTLQDITIPTSNLDRFSVMFAPVLQYQSQTPTVPRQIPRPDMSQNTSSSSGNHNRSATAPCSLPSPSIPTLPPPSRAPPLPPGTAVDFQTSNLHSCQSISSTPRSSLSMSTISTDLEQYYLPARYQCPGDATSSSSQSTPTLSAFPDSSMKPISSHSLASTPVSQIDVEGEAHEAQFSADEASGGNTTTTTLVLPSPPLSAYLSARPYPSPAAPSPTHGFGYDAPHSPLVQIARSVTATATRPRMYAATLDHGVDRLGQDVCLSDSRCGTPVLVQVVGSGRRASQWGMVYGETPAV